MNWLMQLPNFVGSLFLHWTGLLTGGVGVLLLAFWERKHRPITFPQYLALAIAAIISAAYLSWLDEHESRVKAETQIALFNDSVLQRRLFVGDALSTFYIEAQALFHEKITEGDFPDWARREGQFADRAKSWIQENMGRAALMKFQDMDGPSYAFASTAGDQHSDALNWLNRVSANLQALMHDPTWDAKAPKLP